MVVNESMYGVNPVVIVIDVLVVFVVVAVVVLKGSTYGVNLVPDIVVDGSSVVIVTVDGIIYGVSLVLVVVIVVVVVDISDGSSAVVGVKDSTYGVKCVPDIVVDGSSVVIVTVGGIISVSYTHLTLPTNREV